MLNYKKKTIIDVVYHMNIEALLELNAEAPIFVQLNEPVAHTSVVVAQVALPRAVFIVRVRHFRPKFIIQILNICTKKPKLDHYFSRKSRPLDISYIF